MPIASVPVTPIWSTRLERLRAVRNVGSLSWKYVQITSSPTMAGASAELASPDARPDVVDERAKTGCRALPRGRLGSGLACPLRRGGVAISVPPASARP